MNNPNTTNANQTQPESVDSDWNKQFSELKSFIAQHKAGSPQSEAQQIASNNAGADLASWVNEQRESMRG